MSDDTFRLVRAVQRLPQAILFLRVLSKLSPDEAARRAGVKSKDWLRLESPDFILSAEEQALAAKGLGVDEETLALHAITLMMVDELESIPDPNDLHPQIAKLARSIERTARHVDLCLKLMRSREAFEKARRIRDARST